VTAPAGWYSQSDGNQRYWDGELWTEHFAPGISLVTTAPVGVARAKVFLVAWVGALALLLLFVVAAAATSGVGGVLMIVGLAALAVGVVASLRGRVPTLRVASRRAGVVIAASGLVAMIVGVAISPSAAITEVTAAVADLTAAPLPAVPSTADPAEMHAPTVTPSPVTVPVAPVTPVLTSTTPTPPKAGTALAAVATLTVKGRAPKTGYSRDQFGQAWYDTDHNGCDTRNDILRRDLTSRQLQNACKVLAGTLAPDPYTGTTIRFIYGGVSEVDIDHVVALSDAWQKGAASWSAGKRLALANDPLNLLAVDASANRSKGDGDAATWLPGNKAFRCTYVARQVAVKRKYGVWVTAAERDAMTRVLTVCPSMPLPGPGSASTVAVLPRAASTYTPPPVVQNAPAPAPAPLAKQYANCTAMHVDYKGGVALPGAVDHRASGHAQYAPVHSTSLYNANSGSDRDKDGIACEA